MPRAQKMNLQEFTPTLAWLIQLSLMNQVPSPENILYKQRHRLLSEFADLGSLVQVCYELSSSKPRNHCAGLGTSRLAWSLSPSSLMRS